MNTLTALVRPGPCTRCGRTVDTAASYGIVIRGNSLELAHHRCPRLRATPLARDLAIAVAVSTAIVAAGTLLAQHWPALAAAFASTAGS